MMGTAERTEWLIIGNDSYDDAGRINNVPPVKNSIALLKKALSKPCYSNASVVVKANLSNSEFHRAISSFYSDTPEDVIPVFYYCGHGCRRQDKLYFLAKDSINDAVEHTSVEYNYVLQQIKMNRHGRAIIILDCCYSGTANGLSPSEEESPNIPDTDFSNIVCLTSCKGVERAYFCNVKEKCYCYFTYLFSTILDGGINNNESWVSFGEIFSYIHNSITGQKPTILSTGTIISEKILPNAQCASLEDVVSTKKKPDFASLESQIGNGQYTLHTIKTENKVQAADSIKQTLSSTLFFGDYPQTQEGKSQPIEWVVLVKEKDRCLILSRYAIEAKPFNSDRDSALWESCSLREWLNSVFLTMAFCPEEEGRIIPYCDLFTEHTISSGSYNSVQDKIVLLSKKEVEMLLPSDKDRRCAPTDYARKQGVLVSRDYKKENKATCWWWLRSQGAFFNRTSCVNSGGSINTVGYDDNDEDVGVRPAMWISI